MNVTISKKEYLELINEAAKLRLLESGGVDNWDWYDDSLNEYAEVIDCDENGGRLVYGD